MGPLYAPVPVSSSFVARFVCNKAPGNNSLAFGVPAADSLKPATRPLLPLPAAGEGPGCVLFSLRSFLFQDAIRQQSRRIFSSHARLDMPLIAATLKHQISDLVNAAYRLTPEEIALMW